MMFYSEAGSKLLPTPDWVRYMIRLGYEWPRGRLEPRRIAMISMPCDSAGAGLFALGAMIRDLTNPQANDIEGHYDRLLIYANQFLNWCQSCKVRCHPEVRKCGFSREATGQIRSPLLNNKAITIDPQTDFEGRQIAWNYRDGRNRLLARPTPSAAIDFHIHTEPPPVITEMADGLSALPYTSVAAEILGAQPAHFPNLNRSYSGICLAERASASAGQPPTSRKMYEGVVFASEDVKWTLDSLLSVRGWSQIPVSRVASFNCRSRKLDRTGMVPGLVVADGHKAFLTVRDFENFGQSDIIGVIDRNQSREDLESLKAKIYPDDWYCQDEELLCALPPGQPKGMAVTAIRRKS